MAFDSLLLQPKHSGALNLEDAMAEVQVLLSFSSSQGINFFLLNYFIGERREEEEKT
jgi:hypothetical protein